MLFCTCEPLLAEPIASSKPVVPLPLLIQPSIPGPDRLASTVGACLRNARSWAPRQTYRLRNSWPGPRNPRCNEPSAGNGYTLQFANHGAHFVVCLPPSAQTCRAYSHWVALVRGGTSPNAPTDTSVPSAPRPCCRTLLVSFY